VLRSSRLRRESARKHLLIFGLAALCAGLFGLAGVRRSAALASDTWQGTLYTDLNYGGRSLTLTSSVTDLRPFPSTT
jgi:hypothetical protein